MTHTSRQDHQDGRHAPPAAGRRRSRCAGQWDAASHAGEDIWQRLSRVTMGLIVLVGMACALVLFKPQWERRDELRGEVEALVKQYEATRARADVHLEELEWLRSDLNYLECIARDRLDLQKNGEKIIRVVRAE